jgi:hypothetical protein
MQTLDIEPYPKSKALEFYNAEITQDLNDEDKIYFVPFVGVGPHHTMITLLYQSIQKNLLLKKNKYFNLRLKEIS